MILEAPMIEEKDRTEDFEEYAKQRSEGKIQVPPTLLTDGERRLYIRSILREDHTFRIKNKPEEASAKFDKLASSMFKFFRGTALLYYRDYAGTDTHLPIVFTIGDVHPENFGVMPNENNAPFFGVNDFDEAYFAPFSYDIKRGATGFYIACKEQGFKKKATKKVIKSFVTGYLEGLKSFAKDDRERWHQFRLDNSPKMIKKLIEKSQETRKSFLKDNINFKKEEFNTTDDIVPYSKHIEDFQKVVDQYVKDNTIDISKEAKDFFKVKDVAIKKKSGTASLGLDRFWILINGPSDKKDDNIILEMKQARNSALTGLTGMKKNKEKSNKAKHIVKAHNIHLAGGDKFYGYAKYEDKSYLIRERSPFKDDIDLDDLDKNKMRKYARICGQTLAQTHARSDEDTGVSNDNAEVSILQSVHLSLYPSDIYRFAKEATARIKKDYELFKKDHEHGAFDFRN